MTSINKTHQKWSELDHAGNLGWTSSYL